MVFSAFARPIFLLFIHILFILVQFVTSLGFFVARTKYLELLPLFTPSFRSFHFLLPGTRTGWMIKFSAWSLISLRFFFFFMPFTRARVRRIVNFRSGYFLWFFSIFELNVIAVKIDLFYFFTFLLGICYKTNCKFKKFFFLRIKIIKFLR